MNTWDDNTPIYRQIKARVARDILTGGLVEGALLPSVRQVAADSQVNPITVSRAYQELADEGFVEKLRGVGMSVARGAREKLLAQERTQFLQDEWPAIMARMRLLGFQAPPAPSTASPTDTDTGALP